MKINFVIISILILFVFGFILFSNSQKEIKSVCINEKCFFVEIADENIERVFGLSNRDFLDLNYGMLFIFEEETIPGFWMEEMKFQIDIIWIGSDFKIIGIDKNLKPCKKDFCPTYNPEEKIKYVLEINAGLSEDYSFEIGDEVKLFW